MYSVIIRGKRDLRDANLVALTLVVYKTGYVRKEKQLLITGLYSEWDKKSLSFNPPSADNIAKSKLLQQERIRYLRNGNTPAKTGICSNSSIITIPKTITSTHTAVCSLARSSIC